MYVFYFKKEEKNSTLLDNLYELFKTCLKLKLVENLQSKQITLSQRRRQHGFKSGGGQSLEIPDKAIAGGESEFKRSVRQSEYWRMASITPASEKLLHSFRSF